MLDHRPLFLFIESNTSGTGVIFVQKAYELGLTPVLVASDPRKYDYADAPSLRLETCDTYNASALEQLAVRLSSHNVIAGVFSSSEYFIAQAAALARTLGLCCPDADRIMACRDKSVQRQTVSARGIDDLGFALVSTSEEAGEWAAQRQGPTVVKPTRGSGSTGVKLCIGEAEARNQASVLFDAMPETPILIEDFAPGLEYSVELFDGKVCGLVSKHLGKTPYFVECGHDFPARVEQSEAESLGQFAEECAEALGITWGPAHVELRSDGQKIHLVEVNPRLAGGLIPIIIQAASGLDLIGATIQKACGGAFKISKPRADSVALRFIVPEQNGYLVDVTGFEEARAIPGVISAKLDRSLPLFFETSHDFHDRIGHLIAVNPDQQAVIVSIEQAMGCIALTFADDSSIFNGQGVLR